MAPVSNTFPGPITGLSSTNVPRGQKSKQPKKVQFAGQLDESGSEQSQKAHSDDMDVDRCHARGGGQCSDDVDFEALRDKEIVTLKEKMEQAKQCAKHGRSWGTGASVPDDVIESDEPLDPAFKEALLEYCRGGKEFDLLPIELNVQWVCLVSSLLERDWRGDIKPAVLNRVWATLNCFMNGEPKIADPRMAHFMMSIIMVNGQELCDVPTLKPFYDKDHHADFCSVLRAFVTTHFEGDFEECNRVL